MQEAKDSSAIENIITTEDELFRADPTHGGYGSVAAKEVHRNGAALKIGFERVRQQGFLRLEDVLAVQATLEQNPAGLRELPGIVLKNAETGAVVYEPPQDAVRIEHYRGLQGAREQGAWESWVLYILRAVEETAKETLAQVTAIRQLMQETKQRLRSEHPKLCSQELLNNLFRHPCAKVEFIKHDLGVSRPTAMKHLDTLHTAGFVKKTKLGRTNFYITEPLFALLGR